MKSREAIKPARFTVRDARAEDLSAIASIYAYHVRHGLGSFEEIPPSIEEITQRWRDILATGLPFLVAAGGGAARGLEKPLGYAYAAPFRLRSAYRFTVEDSIYVAPSETRRGIGHALLGELIERCTAGKYRQMIAVIGDSGNAASIGLHETLGFSRAGLLKAVGFKAERWIDGVIMQRSLGDGETTPPQEQV
jgi:L-amino acid N-acyltransferase YncA